MITDAQIDAIAAAHEAKYGQLCDADDLRMFARACVDAALIPVQAQPVATDGGTPRVIAFIEKLDERDAWISVDERLPDDDTYVIVLYWPYDNRENKQVAGTAHFYDGCFFAEDWNPHHPPSHWMPFVRPAAITAAGTTHTNRQS